VSLKVLHNKGSIQLWRVVFEALNLLSSTPIREERDYASQCFDPELRIAVNRAEYFQGRVEVSASGRYQPEVRIEFVSLLTSFS
jgi:hypothetical protein